MPSFLEKQIGSLDQKHKICTCNVDRPPVLKESDKNSCFHVYVLGNQITQIKHNISGGDKYCREKAEKEQSKC